MLPAVLQMNIFYFGRGSQMSLSFFLAWKDAQVIPKSLRRNYSPSLPKGAHISPPLRYQNGNMSPGDDCSDDAHELLCSAVVSPRG